MRFSSTCHYCKAGVIHDRHLFDRSIPDGPPTHDGAMRTEDERERAAKDREAWLAEVDEKLAAREREARKASSASLFEALSDPTKYGLTWDVVTT